ncbi:MAG: Mur ligase family protein, partial [Patescibacteria group bacterium]
AQLAHHLGYIVTGCDLKPSSNYSGPLEKVRLKISTGHSADHLKDIDILAVTPAVFYDSDSHPEVVQARERGILMKWQEFMGKYLHEGKFLICVAGTHGKSTTTALAGLLLENAELDPVVEVGATVKEWQNNLRVGKGDYFISEADEFHDNFIYYHPNIIILNNIEMDHPEYFSDMKKLMNTFQSFVNNLLPNGVLIFNADSENNQKLVQQITRSDIKLVPYTLSEFDTYGYTLSIPGDHNKSNALGIIKLAEFLKIPAEAIAKTFTNFKGVGRRLDLIGEKDGIKVYDDYANLPTAFAANISSLKQLYPTSKFLVVIEPHTFSRLRAVLPDLPKSLARADKIIFTKTFASREKDPGDFSSQDLVDYTNKHLDNDKASLINEFGDIASFIKKEAKPNDIVLVMAAGSGHIISREILNSL